MFGACISTGMGVLESCKVAGIASSGPRISMLVRWRPHFIGECVMDDRFDKELESGRGKHPKWVSDENFRADIRKFVLDMAKDLSLYTKQIHVL